MHTYLHEKHVRHIELPDVVLGAEFSTLAENFLNLCVHVCLHVHRHTDICPDMLGAKLSALHERNHGGRRRVPINVSSNVDMHAYMHA